MIEYSRDFDPPAPFMDIIIAASKDSGPQRSVGALLDTGAEVSIIPPQIVHELELSPYAEMIKELLSFRVEFAVLGQDAALAQVNAFDDSSRPGGGDGVTHLEILVTGQEDTGDGVTRGARGGGNFTLGQKCNRIAQVEPLLEVSYTVSNSVTVEG